MKALERKTNNKGYFNNNQIDKICEVLDIQD